MHPVTLGIALGLVFGKSLGITISCWLGVKSGLGELPPDLRRHHIIGVSLFADIGFTMSFYVAGLAFSANNELFLLAKHSNQ